MKNEILKEAKFTKKNSVQRFHYGKFRIKEGMETPMNIGSS